MGGASCPDDKAASRRFVAVPPESFNLFHGSGSRPRYRDASHVQDPDPPRSAVEQDRRGRGGRAPGVGGQGAGRKRARRRGRTHPGRHRGGRTLADPGGGRRLRHGPGRRPARDRAPRHEQAADRRRPLLDPHPGLPRGGPAQHRLRVQLLPREPRRRFRVRHGDHDRGRASRERRRNRGPGRDDDLGAQPVLQRARPPQVPQVGRHRNGAHHRSSGRPGAGLAGRAVPAHAQQPGRQELAGSGRPLRTRARGAGRRTAQRAAPGRARARGRRGGRVGVAPAAPPPDGRRDLHARQPAPRARPRGAARPLPGLRPAPGEGAVPARRALPHGPLRRGRRQRPPGQERGALRPAGRRARGHPAGRGPDPLRRRPAWFPPEGAGNQSEGEDRAGYGRVRSPGGMSGGDLRPVETAEDQKSPGFRVQGSGFRAASDIEHRGGTPLPQKNEDGVGGASSPDAGGAAVPEDRGWNPRLRRRQAPLPQ